MDDQRKMRSPWEGVGERKRTYQLNLVGAGVLVGG